MEHESFRFYKSPPFLCDYNRITHFFNPLNAELNPTCYLLILLGDLTFMGKCIVSISSKIQRYTVYLYLETALHVSGGTSFNVKEERVNILPAVVFTLFYL
jgi:hypothetical protein